MGEHKHGVCMWLGALKCLLIEGALSVGDNLVLYNVIFGIPFSARDGGHRKLLVKNLIRYFSFSCRILRF